MKTTRALGATVFAAVALTLSLAEVRAAAGSAPRTSGPSDIDWERAEEVLFADDPLAEPWRVVEIPGFFVFSRLPEPVLFSFVQQLRRASLSLQPLLPPPEFFGARPPVISIVLFSAEPGEGIPGVYATGPNTRLIVANLRGLVREAQPGTPPRAVRTGIVTPTVPHGPSAHGMIFASVALARLQEREPKLPPWLLIAARSAIDKTRFRGMYARDATVPLEVRARSQQGAGQRRMFVTDLLCSMRDVMEPKPALTRELAVERSKTEFPAACAFGDWALLTEDEARRKRFWIFAGKVAAGPMSEQLVADAFGLTYVQLDEQLDAFLKLRDPGVDYLPPPTLREGELLPVAPQQASALEIRRLRELFYEATSHIRSKSWSPLPPSGPAKVSTP